MNIDNKETNQGFGTIVLVSPQALSVSELIGDIALSLGFKIERDAAQNMMSGLITATQNFQNPRTSSLAFEVASYLMRRGAARTASRPEPQPGHENFAQQFLNSPAPQQQPRPQAQPQPQPQPMPQPQMQPQPAQQPAGAAADRQEELRQQLRDQENLRNGNQPAQQNQPNNNQQDEAAPVDWLTPKVYKGSSNF